MTQLVFAAQGADAGSGGGHAVNHGDYLDLFFAFGLFTEEHSLPGLVKAVLVRVSQQIIGFGVSQVKAVDHGPCVAFVRISQAAFPAVSERYHFSILHR